MIFLKFTSSDMQICWNFLLKKCAVQKLLSFFQQKNIRILYIESAKIVNEMTLNKLIKLTTLWTTGPWYFLIPHQLRLSYSWVRPAILAAGKGRGGMFLFLPFLHFNSFSSFSPVLLFHLLYYLLYLFSPFLLETTQNDPQGLTCR